MTTGKPGHWPPPTRARYTTPSDGGKPRVCPRFRLKQPRSCVAGGLSARNDVRVRLLRPLAGRPGGHDDRRRHGPRGAGVAILGPGAGIRGPAARGHPGGRDSLVGGSDRPFLGGFGPSPGGRGLRGDDRRAGRGAGRRRGGDRRRDDLRQRRDPARRAGLDRVAADVRARRRGALRGADRAHGGHGLRARGGRPGGPGGAREPGRGAGHRHPCADGARDRRRRVRAGQRAARGGERPGRGRHHRSALRDRPSEPVGEPRERPPGAGAASRRPPHADPRPGARGRGAGPRRAGRPPRPPR